MKKIIYIIMLISSLIARGQSKKISEMDSVTAPVDSMYLPIVDPGEALAADRNKRISVYRFDLRYVNENQTVLLSRGGTGSSLTGPGDERILFWNDMEDSVKWLDMGAGLSINDVTDSLELDSDLVTIAGLASTDGNFIVGNGSSWVVESGSTARSSLGLGSLATSSNITDSDWFTFPGTQLTVENGGSGVQDITGVILGNGTSPFSAVPDGTNGQPLTTDGSGNYSFSNISLNNVSDAGALAALSSVNNSTWSGADLSVANGGTGVSSLTSYAPIFGGTTSTGAVQSGTVGTAGQVLTSNGAGMLPTFQNGANLGLFEISANVLHLDADNFDDGARISLINSGAVNIIAESAGTPASARVSIHTGATGLLATSWDENGDADFQGNNITGVGTLGAVSSADINGGTIDNTVIGGSTPAIATFTNATITSTDATFTVKPLGATSGELIIGATGTPSTGSVYISSQDLTSSGMVLRTRNGSGINDVLTLESSGAAVFSGPLSATTGNFSGNVTAANIAGGPYTPTLTAVANLDGTPTAAGATYLRAMSEVMVKMQVTFDTTDDITTTTFRVSLPVSSNFTQTYQLIGSWGATGTGNPMVVSAANDEATMTFTSNGTGSQSAFLWFQYTVL